MIASHGTRFIILHMHDIILNFKPIMISDCFRKTILSRAQWMILLLVYMKQY